ncbi:ML domain-containing protein [Mycena filopes]|nr:ML domain-containing protein [Mycena filopes]
MRIVAPTALLLASLAASSQGRSSIDDQRAFKLSSTAAARSWSWEDCGFAEDAVTVKSIEVFPDPPAPGENLTITVKATVKKRIVDGAYADVTVKLGLVKLLRKKFDVCEEARNANASVTCPVDEGHYEVIQTVALPREIPPAKFTVQVRGFTADEADMVCMDLYGDFRK